MALDHRASESLEDNHLLYETYQTYQRASFRSVLTTESVEVRDDGRIDLDIDSSLGRALTALYVDSEDNNLEESLPGYSPRNSPSVSLNIVIQVVGSRGDVQPFVALGNELQKYGHRVRLATHNVFETFVRQSGLEFYPIGGDPAQLMAYMVKNPGLIPSMKSLREREIQQKRAMVSEILDGCWKSCIEPDLLGHGDFVADAIIANPPSFAHIHCAQALGVPLHLMFTMPWTPTKEFPHPLANMKHSNSDLKAANYISYGLVDFMTWQGLGDIINQWRMTLDLEPVPMTEGSLLVQKLKIPFTYCWSPALVPKPADWGAHIDICGFFFRTAPEYTPPPALDEFLHSGRPTIYIGFGSIVVDDPVVLTKTILEAVAATGVRAVISEGWSKLGGVDQPNVYYIGDCPHEWLFQQVDAVVHHGGAGTTACGLLNGKPTTIVPFFGDQPFWGNMVAAAGAGPKPIPYKSLNIANLSEAIRFCLTNQAKTNAETIAEKMKAEAGVKAAVQSFHANLPFEKLQCDIFPAQSAAWEYRHGSKSIKLSKMATYILLEKSAIDRKRLRLYKIKEVHIENHRWDPITAVSSAAIGTLADMANATAGIILKPYEAVQQGRCSNAAHGITHFHDASLIHEGVDIGTNSANGHTNLARIVSANSRSGSSTSDPRNCSANSYQHPESQPKDNNANNMATVVAVASAKSFGKLLTSYTKGILVELPLAATEGLRVVPRFYSEEPKDHGQVTDWKSGVVVAGKTFGHGMYHGLTDIIVLPYKAKKENGAKGVLSGLSKGVVSMITKTGAGTLGLVAYPAQGIHKSIRASIRKTTANKIEIAKLSEGEWLMMTEAGLYVDRDAVVRSFRLLETA